MNQQQKDKTLFKDKKLEKLVRFFRGKRVELPVKEKKCSNNITINPNYEEDRLGFSGSGIQGDQP